MVQITDAIYTHGVLKPLEDLRLDDQQRVRLIIQPLGPADREERSSAIARLRAGIENMNFRAEGRLPTRDELHDRI